MHCDLCFCCTTRSVSDISPKSDNRSDENYFAFSFLFYVFASTTLTRVVVQPRIIFPTFSVPFQSRGYLHRRFQLPNSKLGNKVFIGE